MTRLEGKEIVVLFNAHCEQAINGLGKAHGAYAKKVALNILHDAQETVNDTKSGKTVQGYIHMTHLGPTL